jgi:hypothetical protein
MTTKRLGIVGLTLTAILACCCALATASASAAEYKCYLVSQFVTGAGATGKGGTYSTNVCEDPTSELLGKWILAIPITPTKENLWCAEILLTLPDNFTGEDGYYTNNTCTTANSTANANKSDFTEIIVPSGNTILPLFTTETSGTGTSGTASLNLEGTNVSCESSTSAAAPASRGFGTLSIIFRTCKSGGKGCISLGQTAGSGIVEVNGEWHLVSLLGNRKSYEIWFLLSRLDNSEAIHIECEIAGLLLIWGNMLAPIAAMPGSNRSYIININRTGTTKQEVEEFGNNNGETVKSGNLRGRVGTGSERLATAESVDNLLFMEQPTTIAEL